MTRYSVVLCGLQPGASDDATVWSPVAVALKLDQADFARQVVAALPRIVRLNMDQAIAERLIAQLETMQISARALPDDDQLVYFLRDGSRRGPLPLNALDAFIQPGETYRLHGSQHWQTWGEAELVPPDFAPPDPGSDGLAEHDDPPATEAEHPRAETTAPIFSDPSGEADASPSAPAESTPPPLPGDEPSAAMPPLPASEPIPAPADETTGETADETVADEAAAEPADSSDAAPAAARSPRRYLGRLIALLLIAALAFWGYTRWQEINAVEPAPPQPARAAAPSNNPVSTTAPARATSTDEPAHRPATAASAPATPATTKPAAATSVASPAAASTTAPTPASTAPTAPTAPTSTATTATTASSVATPGNHASAATGPSFDCADAPSIAAVAICADATLSQLDREQARRYRQALDQATPEYEGALKQAQQQWRQTLTPKCGVDQACLKRQLQAHIAAMPASHPAAAARPTPP